MPEIGKYGRMYRDHLKEHRPKEYEELKRSGRLNQHLAEINQQVEDQWEATWQALLEKNPVPEGANSFEKAAHLGMIQRQVEEMVVTPMIRPMDEDEEAKIGPNGGYID